MSDSDEELNFIKGTLGELYGIQRRSIDRKGTNVADALKMDIQKILAKENKSESIPVGPNTQPGALAPIDVSKFNEEIRQLETAGTPSPAPSPVSSNPQPQSDDPDQLMFNFDVVKAKDVYDKLTEMEGKLDVLNKKISAVLKWLEEHSIEQE